MDIRLELAFVINLLHSIQRINGLVNTNWRTLGAKSSYGETAAKAVLVDVGMAARLKRHLALSRPSPAEPKKLYNYEDGFSTKDHEYGHADGAPAAEGSSTGGAIVWETTPSDEGTTTATAHDNQIVSSAQLCLIFGGIILLNVVLFCAVVFIVYLLRTMPSCRDQEEDDDPDGPGATPKGKPSFTPRSSVSFTRCPSFSQKLEDRRKYLEQSIDWIHKSRGSDSSCQSSCRICPRFAPKSRVERASCVSTASTATSSSVGCEDSACTPPLTTVTTGGKKDYFVSCVCDLPGEEEFSPCTSTTTTFGR